MDHAKLQKQSRRAALYRGLRISIAGAKAQWIQYREDRVRAPWSNNQEGLKDDNYRKHYMDVRQARSSLLRCFLCFHLRFRRRAIQFEDSEAIVKAALLHQGDVDFRVAKRLEIHSRYAAVGNGFVHRRDGHDQRKASPSEFR